MTDIRGEHGRFGKGNKSGKGRPRGALNKIRTPAFLKNDLRLAPAKRFRGLIAQMN
jgi:hypothetical protein